MSAPTGKLSVQKAVERIYPELPSLFSLRGLHASVVRELKRPYLHEDTSRRKLFALRELGIIDFVNTSKPKSQYRKLTLNKQQ